MVRVIFKGIAMVLILMMLSTSFFSCYGNFSLVKKLYQWNGSLGSKLVNSAVAWLLMIVPVYGVAGFIDFVILNVIEYWTGENPVKMSATDRETQIVEQDGITYQITATQNRFDIVELNGQEREVSLLFDEELNAWFVESSQGRTKIAQYQGENCDDLVLYFPDEKSLTVNLTTHPYPLEYAQ